MRFEVETLSKNIDSRHEVIVQNVRVFRFQTRGNDDVGVEALIESKMPPMISCGRLSTPGQDE
jgi:hypothetical protein